MKINSNKEIPKTQQTIKKSSDEGNIFLPLEDTFSQSPEKNETDTIFTFTPFKGSIDKKLAQVKSSCGGGYIGGGCSGYVGGGCGGGVAGGGGCMDGGGC